jgi:hypothetical protein
MIFVKIKILNHYKILNQYKINIRNNNGKIYLIQ